MSTLDPAVIILGGGVSKAGDFMLEHLMPYYRERAFGQAKDTRIVIAELSNDAGIIGGAKLVLDSVTE